MSYTSEKRDVKRRDLQGTLRKDKSEARKGEKEEKEQEIER